MKDRGQGWRLLAVAVIAFFLGRCSAEIPRPDVPHRQTYLKDYT
ncbi:hypothetical protein [Brevundimonas sp.]